MTNAEKVNKFMADHGHDITIGTTADIGGHIYWKCTCGKDGWNLPYEHTLDIFVSVYL